MTPRSYGIAPSGLLVISPLLILILLVEPSSPEIISSFVVHLSPGVAGVAAVLVVFGYWFGEGEFVFEEVVALDYNVDLSGKIGTRLLDWCQFFTELSF